MSCAAATGFGRRERSRRLRRRLLGVLLCDVTAVAALGVVAAVTRSRPSGPVFASIAGVGAASLLPGVIAVAHEERAHRADSIGGHRMTASVLLFGAGLVINTAGTLAVLLAARGPHGQSRAAVAVDVALLLGGDAIGVPYLSLTKALHR